MSPLVADYARTSALFPSSNQSECRVIRVYVPDAASAHDRRTWRGHREYSVEELRQMKCPWPPDEDARAEWAARCR